jgi:hypothetical protein
MERRENGEKEVREQHFFVSFFFDQQREKKWAVPSPSIYKSLKLHSSSHTRPQSHCSNISVGIDG